MFSRPFTVTAALSAGLVLSLTGLMSFPAVLVDLVQEWGLSAAEAGWIGGIYFAGYAIAVPLLSGAVDRVDARGIYALGGLITATASFAFAGFAEGFWSALLLRFLAGVGLAGIQMPGLSILADRLEGAAQTRGSGIYTAAYALGSGGSFLLAGPLAEVWGWRAPFIAGGIGPLLAIGLLVLVGPPRHPPRKTGGILPDFAPVFRSRGVLTYIACYAGNTWEVFAIRVWFVPFLTFTAANAAGPVPPWNPAIMAGVAAILSFPAGIAVAELAVRIGRRAAIGGTTVASILVCGLIAAAVPGSYYLVLLLLLLHGSTSFGDTGAIASGTVAASEPEWRGAALAAYAFAGFTSGFLGPLAVGLAVESAGGMDSPLAWKAAFGVIALGSLAGALIMIFAPVAKASARSSL